MSSLVHVDDEDCPRTSTSGGGEAEEHKPPPPTKQRTSEDNNAAISNRNRTRAFSFQRRRRGPIYLEVTLLLVVIYVVLSLFQLEPLARNMIQDHNIEIDMPHNVERIAQFTSINKTTTNATTNTSAAAETVTVKNAVVHIGPHKTGSSTIQEYTRLFSEQLLEDGYDMPWSHKFPNGTRPQFRDPTHNQVNVATCFITNPNHIEKKGYPCRTDLLEAGKSIGHNNVNKNSILLSAETFDNLLEDEVASLYDYLHPTWNNVTIVAVYRRFYDWLISFHNQVSRAHIDMTTGHTKDLWDVFQQNSSNHFGRSLLDDVNVIIPPQGEVNKEQLGDKPFYLEEYILYAIPRYKKYFANIAVINMHDKSVDLTDSFFCDVIPHANKTCHAFRQKVSKDGTTLQENKSSKDIVYMELAYAAHRRGIFPIKTKKHLTLVVDAMQHYQEKVLNLSVEDFPYKCLSQEMLDKIWAISEQAEQVFGKKGNGSEQEMKADFEKKSKFDLCEVIFDDVIRSDTWRVFFEKHAPLNTTTNTIYSGTP